MSTADTYVRARIDTATKKRAADALEAMGLSIADAMQTKYDLWQAETKQHNVLMGCIALIARLSHNDWAGVVYLVNANCLLSDSA